MTAVVLPGDGGVGTSKQKFIKEPTTRSKRIASMGKVDLLSLFFFDPLHQSFDNLYTNNHKTTPIIITETLSKPSEITETSPSSSSQSNETSSEDHTDPADLSSEDSLHDEVDTCSNMTDPEPAWCGCVVPCTCDDEYYYMQEMQDEIDYECESRWEDRILTARELDTLKFEDEWEERQRTKTQRNGNQKLRAKRSEKKDKVWPARYVRSLASKKQGEKNAVMSEHFERQKGKGNTNRAYVNFGSSQNSHSNHNHTGPRDESAEVQRAIALSLSAPASHAPNTLACGLTQRQLNDLMNRELTPEDYELLLRLDESVAKKTVKHDMLDKFASRAATASDVEESACTICLSEYVIGETLKTLPCGHFFHEACVREWLSKSSVNCPIDNLPVT